jgi:hypothetical protein
MKPQARCLTFPVPTTIEQCEGLVEFVFWQIAGRHGEIEARRIFARCATPLTKSEKRLKNNALLLWQYIAMPKRNISQLATLIAKETGDDRGTLAKRIERAIKSKKVRAYLKRDFYWNIELEAE